MKAREWIPLFLGGQQAWQRHSVQSSPSPVWVRPTAAACSAAFAYLQAEEREEVLGRIRVSETLQSHRGQPVVCLVYTAAVRSQSTHHICSNTISWPCRNSSMNAAVSQRDRLQTVTAADGTSTPRRIMWRLTLAAARWMCCQSTLCWWSAALSNP